MKKIINICLAILVSSSCFTQEFSDRYNLEIFSGYTETSQVQFSTGVPQPKPGGGFYEWITGYPLNVDEWDTSSENLYMDIFEPSGDTISQRPLIVICFGGGFLDGSKDHWSIRLLAQKFARRGYVVATIDYRLGMNIFDSDLSARAVYRGLQDGRSAIRYFKADAAGSNTYRIDTDKIFIGGHSSGGFIALHNLYLDKESERPASTYNWVQDGHAVADQGCLDCAGDNQSFAGNAAACFNLAGALGFTSLIEQANDTTSVMFHSTDDETVPYTFGQPFSNYLWLVVGDDLPDVYGSNSIANRFNTVGMSYDFSSYTNRGHGVHEDGGSNLYADIIPSINDWFFPHFLEADSVFIYGEKEVCRNELIQQYSVDQLNGHYWDWLVDGGSFVSMNNYSNTVTVQWDTLALTNTLSVTPYSNVGGQGDTTSVTINTYQPQTNTFIGTQPATWHDASVWSKGNIPFPCDTIIIPDQLSTLTIDVHDIDPIIIESLWLGEQVILTLKPNANFKIKE